MSKYTFICQQGHEPITMQVEADNDETAMQMMTEKAKSHLAEVHSDMASMSDEQLTEMIRNGWHKEEMGAA